MWLGIFRYYSLKINILLLGTTFSEVTTLVGCPEWDRFPLFCWHEHQPTPLPSETCPGLGNEFYGHPDFEGQKNELPWNITLASFGRLWVGS